jgi:hypothetical protein
LPTAPYHSTCRGKASETAAQQKEKKSFAMTQEIAIFAFGK